MRLYIDNLLGDGSADFQPLITRQRFNLHGGPKTGTVFTDL